MKKLALSLASLATLAFLAGCATPFPQGVGYVEVKMPVAVNSSGDLSKMKTGSAMCKSYVGVVALGDASVATAMKNGGIKTVHAVDWKVKNICGIIGEYECIVYGE